MTRQLSVFLFLPMLACGGDASSPTVADQAPTEQDAPPPPPADVDVAMPELAAGTQTKVDVASSSIEFTGAKITKSHDGQFGKFDGVVVLNDDTVTGTQFSIDLTTATADVEKLTKHLLSKDFFHVEKYATATFVSSEITPAAEPGAVTHDVKGVLDLHGRQRPLSFPASITVGALATTVTATFDINRQNWGVSYPGSPDNLIKDDVQIRLNLSFPVNRGTEDKAAGSEDEAASTAASGVAE